MPPICRHGFAHGKVQGVWYRAFIQQQALDHQLAGWAKNLADGRVEFLLCGEPQAIDAVIKAMYQGPEYAEVTAIDHEQTPWQEINGFSTA